MVGVVLAFTFALAYGFLNGWLVVKTGLSSFIITLAGLFILRGLALALARLLTGSTVVGGLAEHTEGDPIAALFTLEINNFAIAILWWAAIAAVCHWLLVDTRQGNWISGAGGSASSARNLGVPVNRVKIALFMGTASAACLLAVIQVLKVGSADANRGRAQGVRGDHHRGDRRHAAVGRVRQCDRHRSSVR